LGSSPKRITKTNPQETCNRVLADYSFPPVAPFCANRQAYAVWQVCHRAYTVAHTAFAAKSKG